METFKVDNPDIIAEIYYLTAEEKGRNTPVFNGYNGQFYYDGRDWDAIQDFVDKEICLLGESVTVRVKMQSLYFHVGRFWVGKAFEIREGMRIVGKGRVLEVVKKELMYWEAKTLEAQMSKDGKSFWGKEIKKAIALIKRHLSHIDGLQTLRVKTIPSSINNMVEFDCVTTKDKYGINSRVFLKNLMTEWVNNIATQFDEAHIKTTITEEYYICHFAILADYGFMGTFKIKK